VACRGFFNLTILCSCVAPARPIGASAALGLPPLRRGPFAHHEGAGTSRAGWLIVVALANAEAQAAHRMPNMAMSATHSRATTMIRVNVAFMAPAS
jgi:hypothetical protein